MSHIKKVSLIILTMIAVSCSSNSKLEHRVTALERRVAALESGNTATGKASGANVASATKPENLNNDQQKPVFSFETTEFDFVNVNEGEIVNHIFEFTNTGTSPLVIDRATASCGCTVPDWPRHPIGVGEKGEIKVRFDTRNKPNQQIKTISITANTEPTLTRLRIKGFVTPKDQQTAGPVK